MSDLQLEIKETVKRMRDRLSTYLKDNYNSTLIDLKIAKIIERSFSVIVFLDVENTNGPKKMVMKKVIHHPINLSITKEKNQAVVEYEILNDLYPQFESVEGCSVPKPIIVAPEEEAFLMEHIKGNSLSDYLPSARYLMSKDKFVKLKNYYFLLGRWLSNFQKFTGSDLAGKKAFSNILERIHVRLELIESKKSPRLPADTCNRINALIESNLTEIKSNDVLVSGRHGDFGHWNILVENDDITVIDFLGYQKEPVIFDLMKVLISLEGWKNHIAYSGKRLDALRANLLKGFGELPRVPKAIAVLCELYHRITVIGSGVTNKPKRPDEKLKSNRTLKENLLALDNIRSGNVIWPNVYS